MLPCNLEKTNGEETIHPGGKGHLEMAKLIFQTFNIFDPESPCCNPVGTPYSL